MKQGFRQSMAWLHTWAGLVTGWVMFAVFVTGTATYYKSDISLWMRPELRAQAEYDVVRATELGVAYLKVHAPKAMAWYVGVPQPDKPYIGAYWMVTPDGEFGKALLDPDTGAPTEARATQGGDFFYRFHFELQMLPALGRWIVGICAMVLLVALISGIVTHRRIFADFFTFRRSKSAQRGWLDAHNVTGVLALPFHLMITYTGIVSLALMYMPWGMVSAYKGDELRFYVESGQMPAWRAAEGKPAEPAPLGPLIRRAQAEVSEPLEMVSINNPGDANATVVAVFEEPHGLAHRHPQIAFHAVTGEVVERTGPLKPAAHAYTSFVGLHEAHFAGPALRILFFLSGLMGCAAIATGLVLWTVARAPKGVVRPAAGWRLVHALNIGTILGLPIGMAALFLANRLVPVEWAARESWESGVFFGIWLLAALIPLARPHRRAWGEMSYAAALLFLAVPLVDWVQTGWRADFLGFDAAMVALALVFLFGARKLGRHEGTRREAARTTGDFVRA
ncbi:PepSY-associated TM helix domain-containing protein [Methylobacterium sp. Leaf106]|uniref:PepSY-associated TM helix domain-containing protein n=1 Tax=Methylobacterium sp. Leaf106 TaxID=1736255 RepID=UPI0006F23608|nr:PepSY-associated TM helix domain-containing protein [Methylobacterium sp. Leaf106]KQP47315.1 peptidase [Methylobacterium sp. Leaf106]